MVRLRSRPRGVEGMRQTKEKIRGEQNKGLSRPFFVAPPNERRTAESTPVWCNIPARVKAQYGWDKWSMKVRNLKSQIAASSWGLSRF